MARAILGVTYGDASGVPKGRSQALSLVLEYTRLFGTARDHLVGARVAFV